MTDLFDVLEYSGENDGPCVVMLAGVHGNEPGCSYGLKDVQALLDNQDIKINKGTLVIVPDINRKALSLNQRYVDRDLNRRLQHVENPKYHEDYIANALCPILERADILLDLHAYNAGDTPFIFHGPPRKIEMDFARALGPHFFVWGFQNVASQAVDELEGIGTREYAEMHGSYGVTVECGHKYDHQKTRQVGKAVALRALLHLDMTDPNENIFACDMFGDDPNVFIVLSSVCVKQQAGEFVKPWRHLDFVKKGSIIATYKSGEDIKAKQDSYIILPDDEAEIGSNWFYFGLEDKQQS